MAFYSEVYSRAKNEHNYKNNLIQISAGRLKLYTDQKDVLP